MQVNKQSFSFVCSYLMVTVICCSMGGHGALICALKNPFKYASVSAFSPISNPTECPWGKKAFSGFLGPDNLESWKQYDATCLVSLYDGPPLDIFIDQVITH